MNISIFGLGYVGCVGAGCLSYYGHNITGVDISLHKVNLINKGIPTIIEKDIEKLIKSGFDKGILRATISCEDAIFNTDASFICVGTPNDKYGHLNLDYILGVAKEIGQVLVKKKSFHTIIIRSTVIPGTNEKLAEIISNESGKINGLEFCVVSNPEFLREGDAVSDYINPPMTVIGSSCQRGIDVVKAIYKDISAPVEIVSIKVAESIKLINNTFHALKVAFGNEVGAFCKSQGIDTDELISLFLSDKKLNISEAYLRPGFAYGGSCLPKDLKALQLLAHDNYLKCPILESISQSNEYHIQRCIDLVISKGRKRIGIWGITFKEGTDDLRNSAIIHVTEILLGKGFDISIYDKNVNQSQLIGANKEYIDSKVPHFSKLLKTDFNKMLGNIDLLIINAKDEQHYSLILERKELQIIDLKNIKMLTTHTHYEGLNF